MSGAGQKLICRGIAIKNVHIVATSEKITITYGCLLENGINPSESIRGKTFNEPITTVQL